MILGRRAQHFEAAQVGAEQECSAMRRIEAIELVQAVAAQVEEVAPPVEEEDPVVDGAGEGVHVAKDIQPGRSPAEASAQESLAIISIASMKGSSPPPSALGKSIA